MYRKAFYATQNVYSESLNPVRPGSACKPVWSGSAFPEWPGQASPGQAFHEVQN